MTTQERIEKLEQEIAQLKKEMEKESRLWQPMVGGEYFTVNHDMTIDCFDRDSEYDERIIDFYNCFPTKEQAIKASEYMYRSNMIIKACLQVDPFFEPDWNDGEQKKYGVYFKFSINKWLITVGVSSQEAPCYVSTSEKAQQVCDLLDREEAQSE